MHLATLTVTDNITLHTQPGPSASMLAIVGQAIGVAL
eukprot:COSAG06_NODE_32154_length_510_cov_1.041363_1_plen_36_part_10